MRSLEEERARVQRWARANPNKRHAAYARRRDADPLRVKTQWCAAARKRRTGWSNEEYHTALIDQAGLCAICEKSMKVPCADHDHITGKIRELLCPRCNQALAHYENESIQSPFVEYLRRHT